MSADEQSEGRIVPGRQLVMCGRGRPRAGRGPALGLACGVLQIFMLADAGAQIGLPGGPPPPQPAPQEAAPFDMTGYWVAIVNEDWRWRMVTPPKGDTMSIAMLNADGRAEAERWDETQDGSCKAFGAAALLRMPTRLRISWESETVLKIETDAGEQTRLLMFSPPQPPGRVAATSPAVQGTPSLQGSSVAEWVLPRRPGGPRAAAAAAPAGGSLLVTTTNLSGGWLRRNGVPYSDRTIVTEHFDQFAIPTGDEWLVVTTIVEDPVYLNEPFITSSHFRRERDGARWNPQPCRAD